MGRQDTFTCFSSKLSTFVQLVMADFVKQNVRLYAALLQISINPVGLERKVVQACSLARRFVGTSCTDARKYVANRL